MEKNGLLRSRIKDVSITQERRFYRLTQKGRHRISGNPIPCGADTFPEPPEDHTLSMRIILFRRWASDAVIGIHISPDREIVSRELFGHLYDCFCENVALGMTPDEAQQNAFEAAGNAIRLSKKLSVLHKPFWTRALRLTRRIIAILAVIVCFTYGLYFLNTRFFSPAVEKFDPDAGPVISGRHTLIATIETRETETSDGYTLSVDNVSVWQTEDTDSRGNPRERTLMNVQLRCFNPLPWANVPKMEGWIWAEDSLGNYYYSSQEDSLAMEPAISSSVYQTGMLSYTMDLWIYQFVSQDAEWIEFHYDRSGRDLVFRVVLTGVDMP